MNPIRRYLDIINETANFEQQFYITYHKSRIVYHTTGANAAAQIRKHGFKTGHELGVAERRKAIYFADKDVNPNLYARNREHETYAGQAAVLIPIDINGLKLLNMSYVSPEFPPDSHERWINRRYQPFVVRGELDQIPLAIDGTIAFLKTGEIYEVSLPVETANRLL